MEELDYWRLCEELNVIQAALLIVGEAPAPLQDYVEIWEPHKRPKGYDAAKAAISRALLSKVISGKPELYHEYDMNSNPGGPIDGSINIKESWVEVSSLRDWLTIKGFRTGFFFPTKYDSPDYLNPQNPNYAPKLAAAIRAWQAVTTDTKYLDNGKHVKQNLEAWLTAHAAQFDLVKDDGEINVDAIKNQISKVANWKDKGGAPKTPNL